MIKPKRLVKLYCVFPYRQKELVLTVLQNLGAIHLIDVKEGSEFLQPIGVDYYEKLKQALNEIKARYDEFNKKAGKAYMEWLFGPKREVVEPVKKKMKTIVMEAKELLKGIKQKYGNVTNENAEELKNLYSYKMKSSIEQLEDLKEKAKRAETCFKDFEEEAKSAGIKYSAKILISRNASQTILDEIEVQNPDIVVMGSHGITGLKKFLLGSVSTDVLKRSAAPVLIVK